MHLHNGNRASGKSNRTLDRVPRIRSHPATRPIAVKALTLLPILLLVVPAFGIVVSTGPEVTLMGTITGGQFGFSVRTAGDVNGDGYSDVLIGAPLAAMGQTAEGSVYVYYGSMSGIQAAPSQILQIDVAGAQFGYSLGLAGDVNGDGFADVIVGAPTWKDLPTQNNEGAAFIFHGSAAGLSATPNSILQSNITNTYMGSSVAGLGDINGDGLSDVMAGGWIATFGQTQEGAVYVHLGSATGVSIAPIHRLERDQAAAQFGRSIAGAGDVNGDGYNDAIIGAYRYDLTGPSGTDDGAVFIYFGGPTGFGIGTNPAPGQTFNTIGYSSHTGWSVSTAGDVNADGYSDVIIGDWRDNIGGQINEGTAFVFHGSAAGLITAPATIIQNDLASSWIGRSVSTAGDVNGDGYADIIVGALIFSNGQNGEGAAYVHLGSPTGISSTYFLRYESNSVNAQMGESVSCAGDVNGDGFSDMIVGIFMQGATGAVAIYHGGTYNVSTAASFNSIGNSAGDHHGWSVANAGDVNGDGYSDLLIGSPDATAGEGRAVIYHGGAGGPSNSAASILQVNIAGARFGASVASAGDVNGDGYADVIIGAPGANRAWVFHGSPTGISSLPAITLAGTAGSMFGTSVSTAGDVNGDGRSEILVGAPGIGEVHLHMGSISGISSTPTLVLSQPSIGFGTAVATAGDVNGDGYSDVIIGAPLYNNGQANEGAAFIHHGSIDGLQPAIAILLEGGQVNARSGTSVAGAGDVNGDGFFDVIVGAPGSTSVQTSEGAASLYRGSATGIINAPVWTLQSDQANAALGSSVAEGGDINGDGYADVVIGAPNFSNEQTNEGRVFTVLGSNSFNGGQTTIESNIVQARAGWSVAGGGDLDGDGYSDVIIGAPYGPSSTTAEGLVRIHRGNNANSIQRLTRQYQADLIGPLSTNNTDGANSIFFGIGHRARSPIQRTQAKLHWEVVHEGEAFSGNPITNSVQSTGASIPWTNLPLNGAEIKELIPKLPNYIRHKWRVRVEYPMHRSLDGQRYSRWFYGFASGHGDIGILPVELIGFTGEAIDVGNLLAWSTASEKDCDRFMIERGTDPDQLAPIGQVEANGNSQQIINYQFLDQEAPAGLAYYRLMIVDEDGSIEYSHTIAILRRSGGSLIHPNPCHDLINWHSPNTPVASLQIIDAFGRIVKITEPQTEQVGFVSVIDLPPSTYGLLLLDEHGSIFDRARFVKQ